ncbi:hypothetical protein GUJ93_ZPchr0006g46246 [Zizania palustris]|uniref:Pentacotripeptide-repeat region of PRORP domain-containing protein n=1 Tax=Zizania palustris TaxID=103762 RepID=A0A8J5QPB8_ZIZPA|nr:hypothetical protein GUJ93_ZPchr0024g29082 [Zizania palustris]KAG8071595.1 hypothetical protein GUJ93_ZPchr0006g46246 [Zizania palustris]
MPPRRALPLPHFTLPPLAGEDLLFVTALRSHLSSTPPPATASLSRFLPQLSPLRLSHLILLATPSEVPHNLLASLLPPPPPPLPFALLLHSLRPRCSAELLASLLPSVSHHAFPDLLHHVVLTARLAAPRPDGGSGGGGAVPALSVLFSACARGKKLSQATLVFRTMRAHGLLPRVEGCNVFISAALSLKRPEIAVSFFREMRRCRISPNTFTANMLLRAFCDMGRIADACEVLDKIPEWGVDRTTVSFNTLIAAYCREGDDAGPAVQLKKKMEQQGLEQRTSTTASRVHEEMARNRVELDIVTYNTLILGLCNEGKMKKVEHLLRELETAKLERNASTFSALIIGWCKMQNSERALQLLNAMKKSGFHPNYPTYKMVISSFCKNKDFEGVIDVMRDMLERCIAPDKALLHEFFDDLWKAQKLHLAESLQSLYNGVKFIPVVYYSGDYRNKDEVVTKC